LRSERPRARAGLTIGRAFVLLAIGLSVAGPANAGGIPAEDPSPAAGRTAPAAEAAPPVHAVADQPVGPEDLLEVSVFEVPELNRTVRVSEKGAISLPLIGEVKVAGLTAREVEIRLREVLAEKYVADPQVTVLVKEFASRKVSVLGAVGKPGVYEMLGPRNLMQVLSQAGGLTPQAGAELFVIRRTRRGGDPGQEADTPVETRTAIDIQRLITHKDPALNVAIEAGDIVSVPIDRPIYIYVDGAVKTPGRIEQLESRPITLLQAIAKAGGATDLANLKKVQVIRKGGGTQETVVLNVQKIRDGKAADPTLQEGDVVVVPETFF
jgi:polysaccharide export outer membrane protein